MGAEIRRLGARFLLTGASEVFRPDPRSRAARRTSGAVIYVEDGLVSYVGPESGLPSSADRVDRYEIGGRAILPAFIDCHTHIVFGGDRVEDFSRRAEGLTYAEIAAQGGGIHTTVEATRTTSTETLVNDARDRLRRRRDQGILTTEVKSGYGLNEKHELRMLEVVSALKNEGWDVEATLLAAHVVPKDQPREDWVRTIANELIPEVARRGLARFVDIFIEASAYTVPEARLLLEAGRSHGLKPRVHADQITSGGGAELAADVYATSADHLERISDEGVRRLAEARVVAGLLPGAMLHLGDRSPGLGRRLVDAGVEVAVATDGNPGSSPTHNLGLMATLAVTQLGLTAEEALRACTLGAARALARDDVGHLEPGALARFAILDHSDARAWAAAFGEPMVAEVILSSRDPSAEL